MLGTLLFEASEFEPAQSGRSTAFAWRDRSRTRRCCARGGPTPPPRTSSGRWFRGASWREREPTDAAVQEALLALPYAYSKLNVHGRAALLYGRAVEAFGERARQARRLASRASAEGEFLEALVREEIRQDKDWVIRLRSLPDAPETFYLMALMASHDFQTALQNYLDLEDLRKKLVSWQGSLDAFDDIIRCAGSTTSRCCPRSIAVPESSTRRCACASSSATIDQRLQDMLIAPRPDYLATADERIVGERIALLDRT